jgi:uncharacterized protein
MALSHGEHVLLRVYLDNADRPMHAPTHEQIVKEARRHGMSGVTVVRGIAGFGHHGVTRLGGWHLVEHVPVVVEVVDEAERIGYFVTTALRPLMDRGMLTLERARVMMYRPRQGHPGEPSRLGPPQPHGIHLPELPEADDMEITDNGVLVRVFCGEGDRCEGKPLFRAIMEKARAAGLAGATVLRGITGFGANSIVHRSMFEYSTDLPIVVEMVDTKEKIEAFLPQLDTMVKEGMITMEYVCIVAYRHAPQQGVR